MTDCLTLEDLYDYFDDPRTHLRLQAHLRECEACRELVRPLEPRSGAEDTALPRGAPSGAVGGDAAATGPPRKVTKRSEYTLPVIDSEGHVLGEGLVRLCRPRGIERECQVELQWNGEVHLARGEHYFRALKVLRRELRALGLDVLCNGSLINCFVSGMAATSTSGLKAYLLTEGSPATLADLVATFDAPSGAYTLGSPDEQDEFLERYLLSLAS